MKKMFRHGDVFICEVESLPSDSVFCGDRKILFSGEKTFHHHSIDVGELFETKDGMLYLKVSKLTKLGHDEHKTIDIPKGIYIVTQKRAYSPDGGWNPVRD